MTCLLGLAACHDSTPFEGETATGWKERPDPQGILGWLIDRAPPPVRVKGPPPPAGPLSDPIPPLLPASAADAVVGEELQKFLTPDERQRLAEASELAAATATGTAVVWLAKDSDGLVTAEGTVTPARDVYLSHRGYICRDLQQRVDKGDAPRASRVTLCRADLGNGLTLWMPGSPD